jgi:hypothetical protein
MVSRFLKKLSLVPGTVYRNWGGITNIGQSRVGIFAKKIKVSNPADNHYFVHTNQCVIVSQLLQLRLGSTVLCLRIVLNIKLASVFGSGLDPDSIWSVDLD